VAKWRLRINVLAKHRIEQQFKDLEEDVAGVKRAHAAILRGKSVSVNSAFTSFRGDKSALEISVHQRQSAVSASARFRLHLISTRRAGATIKFLAFSASLR
jgi:hypothetical protein